MDAHQELLKEYKTMLKSARKTKMNETILECGTNIKCLYSLVNNIIGKHEENPFPDGKSDNHLAKEFADFFLNKIAKIWDDSEQTEKFNLENIKGFSGEHLRNLCPVTEKVLKIMNSMPSK